jgi:preprotein translocase subunit SecG
MVIFITGLHVCLCFFLILVVLLQPGKGADFGAAMGGVSQGGNAASGPTTVMGRLTAIVATMFMVTSMTLAYYSNQEPDVDVSSDQLQEILDAQNADEEATPEPDEVDPDGEESETDPTGETTPEGEEPSDSDPEGSDSTPSEDAAPEAAPSDDEAATTPDEDAPEGQ